MGRTNSQRVDNAVYMLLDIYLLLRPGCLPMLKENIRTGSNCWEERSFADILLCISSSLSLYKAGGLGEIDFDVLCLLVGFWISYHLSGPVTFVSSDK